MSTLEGIRTLLQSVAIEPVRAEGDGQLLGGRASAGAARGPSDCGQPDGTAINSPLAKTERLDARALRSGCGVVGSRRSGCRISAAGSCASCVASSLRGRSERRARSMRGCSGVFNRRCRGLKSDVDDLARREPSACLVVDRRRRDAGRFIASRRLVAYLGFDAKVEQSARRRPAAAGSPNADRASADGRWSSSVDRGH